jgi:two-component system sensor kinase FixL
MPIPLLAALVGLSVGLLVWGVLDRIQTRALGEIFAEELGNQVQEQARESLLRFTQFINTYTAATRLLANHRRMASYLQPLVWNSEQTPTVRIYAGSHPPWLPDLAIWQSDAAPAYMLLVDANGEVREAYQARKGALPLGLSGEGRLSLPAGPSPSFLTVLDGVPHLVVAEPIEDESYNLMGSLVVVVPVDRGFLMASQAHGEAGHTVLALVDGDERILASTDPAVFLPASPAESFKQRFVVTVQALQGYEQTDQNLMFASFTPRQGIETTSQRIIELERTQRLTGAIIITLSFVLLFVALSARINQVLRRVSQFAWRALGIQQAAPERGNQLLILEEWIREFIQMVLITRDEMRARHASEIREREALQASLMDASLDSIITTDGRGRITEFNPTAELTFGYRREQVLGQRLDRLLLAPGSRTLFNQRLEESVGRRSGSGEAVRIELEAVKKDGNVIPVELAIKPLHMDASRLQTVYIHDISDRKRQEAEIASLAAFPSESPIPMLRVNRHGVVIYANSPSEPLLRHWGCGRLQPLPVYWKQLVLPVLESGRTQELELQTDDATFSLLLAPIRTLGYVNLYARDVTAMRAAEAEVRRRQDELVHVSRLSTMGEMATGIAHELNQPLSAIINFANGCARRLKLGTGGDAEMLDALQQIANQANRAGEIIKRLRGMVGRQQPVREDNDLNALVQEVCALLSHETRKLQVQLELRLDPQPLYVRVDSVQIEQAVLNLMRNALDALQEVPPEQRQLILRSGVKDGNRVYVSVQDTGPGMRGEVMQHLFDPFFTTKASGMGVGLAIAQTIIDDHKGRIRAESWPGKGTTFTIELPACADATQSLAS